LPPGMLVAGRLILASVVVITARRGR